MQLNTIAGRTYNDLSQYPVVSALLCVLTVSLPELHLQFCWLTSRILDAALDVTGEDMLYYFPMYVGYGSTLHFLCSSFLGYCEITSLKPWT